MAGIHFRHVWNIGADPQLVVVKTAFPKALWKGYAITTESILFHLMLRSAFPASSVFQSSQSLKDLRTFHVPGIPSLWTVVVGYEWPCMPCDIIAMLPTGHGMVASPLKCTNPRTPGTFGCNVSWMCLPSHRKHCMSLMLGRLYHSERRPVIWI